MASVSKNALIMQNRIKDFLRDIELVSFLCVLNTKTKVFENNEEFKTLFEEYKIKYKIIDGIFVKKSSRNLLFQHLRKMVYIAVIKEIYEEFSEYLRGLIEAVAVISKNTETAGRILGECNIKISGRDILRYVSLDELKKDIADDIVRQLEKEKSTMLLIKKVCKSCDLLVSDEIITEALPYLNLRHILVHKDGKADMKFKNEYGKVFAIDKNGFVMLNSKVVYTCKEKVEKLMLQIDKLAIQKGLLKGNT